MIASNIERLSVMDVSNLGQVVCVKIVRGVLPKSIVLMGTKTTAANLISNFSPVVICALTAMVNFAIAAKNCVFFVFFVVVAKRRSA